MRRLSPATRTMKNSSRLFAKIARKRTRSSSGSCGSRASSSTRSLNASHDSSRSRNRSDPRRTPSGATAVAPVRRRAVVTRLGGGAVPVVVVAGTLMPRWWHGDVNESRCRGCPQEHDVGVPLGEPERPVHGARRGVVPLDVEHRLGQAEPAQVPQARHRERPAEAAALLTRGHPHDVHLADRLVPLPLPPCVPPVVALPLTAVDPPVIGLPITAMDPPVIGLPITAMDLRPVEA